MVTRLMLAGLAALAAGCNVQVGGGGSMVDAVEADVRNGLAPRGEVGEVDLRAQGEDRMAGHAMVRSADGVETRYDCTAQRRAEGEATFDWECTPPAGAK